MKKLISRVARVRSEESRLEALADPSKLGDLNEQDPRSMARWMKKMGRELGEDFNGDFEEMMEAADEEVGTEQKELDGENNL
jgi:hypothetical protein